MNRLRLISLVLVILIVGSGDATALGRRRRSQPIAPLPSPAMAESSQPSNLQRMHALRVEAAQKHYELVKQQYQLGGLRSDELIKAQKVLLEASFEAATTPEARLLTLKEGVKLAATDYEHVTLRRRGGAASELDLAGTQYSLLTAEIRLAEEEERQATRKPLR